MSPELWKEHIMYHLAKHDLYRSRPDWPMAQERNRAIDELLGAGRIVPRGTSPSGYEEFSLP